ncbi:MAG: dihydrolipoamide acetyltransferase family protein [Beijerinckiaceae bacterium]
MRIFRLPDLGEGLQEAEIVEWRVKAGDEVAVDQPLLAVETAKAVVEIPSPYEGRVERLFAKVGEIVRLGAPVVGFAGAGGSDSDAGAIVGEVKVGEQVQGEAPSAIGHGGAALKATPAVRALARQLDVDLTIVTPTSPGGVISAGDIRRVARILAEVGPAEPLRGVRRAMAQNMALAQSEVAAATVMEDADVDAWPPRVDVTVRLVRALVAGCRAEPGLNAWFESKSLGRRVLQKIDVGIAVDLPDGLFVPVLRDVANRTAEDLRLGLDRMRADISARKIPPEELRGATITLSNFGMIAGKYAAPIVVPPTVAILAAGRIRQQAVVVDCALAIRRILPLSLTFDHRVVTGGEAARFLAAAIDDLKHAD